MTDFERLSARLVYDPETGFITWRNGKCAGARAGSLRHDGRRQLRADGRGGKMYQEHRLAWLLYYGEWPENEIDHINRNPADNRIQNLRDVTRGQNEWNKNAKGVSKNRLMGKWVAYIRYNGTRMHLGWFSCFGQAVKARKDAAKEREMLP